MRYLNRRLAALLQPGDLVRTRSDIPVDEAGRTSEVCLDTVTRVLVHDEYGTTVWVDNGVTEVVAFSALPYDAEVEVGTYDRP